MAKGYSQTRVQVYYQQLQPSPMFTEACSWWIHPFDETDVINHRHLLSKHERLDILAQISADSDVAPQLPDKIKAAVGEGLRGGSCDNSALGCFEGGEGLKFRSTYFKTASAPTRIDALYTYHYCAIGDIVGKILKLVSWKAKEDTPTVYLAKIVGFNIMTTPSVDGSGYMRRSVDLTRDDGNYGEFWVLVTKLSQPMLIPQYANEQTGTFKVGCFDVCVATPDQLGNGCGEAE